MTINDEPVEEMEEIVPEFGPELDIEGGPEDEVISDPEPEPDPELLFPIEPEPEPESEPDVQDYFLPTSHECDTIFVRLYTNASKIMQLQNLKATLEMKLRRAKVILDRDCNAAINNWDSKEKYVKDPSRPFNDGSNDPKRDAISRELFPAQFAEIDVLQTRIDDITLELLDPIMYKALAEIEARNIETQLEIAKEARLAGIKFNLSDLY